MQDPREIVKETFSNAFCKYPIWHSLPESLRETILRRIERSCYNELIDQCKRDQINRCFTDRIFTERYQTIAYRVESNLNINESNYLALGIIKYISDENALGLNLPPNTQSIDPDKVGSMRSIELCPEASAAERNDIDIRQQQKVEDKWCKKYECKVCGQKNATVLEYTGRSADEALKHSFKCKCGNIWNR